MEKVKVFDGFSNVETMIVYGSVRGDAIDFYKECLEIKDIDILSELLENFVDYYEPVIDGTSYYIHEPNVSRMYSGLLRVAIRKVKWQEVAQRIMKDAESIDN